jgi:glucosamine-6-phosphate deaminase
MNDWSGKLSISPTRNAMAETASQYAVQKLVAALARKSRVRLLAATGASQLEFLERVTASKEIEWNRIELFHLDEYIGLGETHPASFAGYIQQRIVNRTGIPMIHLLDGLGNPEKVIGKMNAAVSGASIDVAFIGIGENGHLAFNDPPADFETEVPYLRVRLDEACRRQQVGEGWFRSLEEVPTEALSMSVRQILKSESIICVVPDNRKAAVMKAVVEGPVTPQVPASILRIHPDIRIFLDADSASSLAYHIPAG